MEKRIYSKITHPDEQERDYFYEKAKQLGYSSFVDFAKAAMKKEIESNDYAASNLSKIADLAGNLEQVLSTQEDHEKLTAEEKQAKQLAELIYNLAIHSDAMLNSPQNQVWVDDPAYLDGDKPGYKYKYPLQAGFDIQKYLKL